MADIADTTPNHIKRKRPSIHVDFNEEEEVINPGAWWEGEAWNAFFGVVAYQMVKFILDI